MIHQDQKSITDFYLNLANNSGSILCVKSVSIKDEVKNTLDSIKRIPDFRTWVIDEIPVVQMDFLKTEGYVRINGEFDVPLQRLEPANGDYMYFYDKNTAVTKVTLLNKQEWDLIQEFNETWSKIFQFQEEIVENNRY